MCRERHLHRIVIPGQLCQSVFFTWTDSWRYSLKKKIVTLSHLFCVSPEFSTILLQGAKLTNGSFQANLQYFSKNNKPSP